MKIRLYDFVASLFLFSHKFIIRKLVKNMKLTREQAKNLDLIRCKPYFKEKLTKKGENALYHVLRKKYPTGKVGFWSITEYVEMLKKELEQDNTSN